MEPQIQEVKNEVVTESNKLIVCPCGITFTNERAYKRHIKQCKKVVSPSRSLKCKPCARYFKFQNHFQKHTAMWHSTLPGSKKCDLCIAVCPDEESLREHVAAQHVEKPDTCCPVCKQTFTRTAHLWRHQATTSCGDLQPEFPCDICGAHFRRKDNLIAHLRRQHILRQNVTCKKCTFATRNLSRLMKHDRDVHCKGVKMECDTCGKLLSSRPALIKHMEVHVPDKPHRCDVCGYRTFMVDVLRRHVLTHVRERPHRCALCPRSFIQRMQLRRHMESRHSDTADTKPDTKPDVKGVSPDTMLSKLGIECEVCGLVLPSPGRLRKHLESHRLEPPRRCMYCARARAFARSAQLLAHVRRAHPHVFRDHLAHVRLVLGSGSSFERVSRAEREAVLQILDAESERILRAYGSQDVLYGGMARPGEDDAPEDDATKAAIVPHVMTEEQLRDSVHVLLTKLVDEEVLRCLGWPAETVDIVLERVVEKCGGRVAGNNVYGAARLREHAKQLLAGGGAVDTMLRARPVDHVITSILSTVGDG